MNAHVYAWAFFYVIPHSIGSPQLSTVRAFHAFPASMLIRQKHL